MPIWKINFYSMFLRLSVLSVDGEKGHVFLRMVGEVEMSRKQNEILFLVAAHIVNKWILQNQLSPPQRPLKGVQTFVAR